MRIPQHPQFKWSVLAALACLAVGTGLFFWSSVAPARAQSGQDPAAQRPQPATATVLSTNTTPAIAQVAPASSGAPVLPATQPVAEAPSPRGVTNSIPSLVAGQQPGQPTPGPGGPAGVAAQQGSAQDKEPTAGEIALSLQGANVDTVVEWLAKATGKSVVKHPKVQCQLTIVSSKAKLPVREAVNLVYRALALEGFSTIESSKTIVIAPEGQEPKTSPELVDSPGGVLPEGRQRLIKIFRLEHVPPAEIKEKLRGVLSEKATMETDEHGNSLIVTDYTDNLRLLGELIKEMDTGSSADSTIEIIPLQHAEADELATLLGLILNGQAAPGGQGMPGQPMPGMPGQPMPGQPMPGQPMSGQPGRPSQSGGGNAGQPVRFWPDKTSNRLIVSAPKSKMAEVHKLLEILDTEKPQDVAVRVIPLKNVTAEDLVKEIGPLYQKLGGKSVKDMIEVTASSRANSLIVLSSEANFKVIEKLIASLDNEDAQEKVMKAFALKNADAEDVAKQLKDLTQDSDSQRYPYYIFSSSGSANGKSSKKMSVVADRRRNTVVVQAPPGSMESIAQMIQTLDEPVTDNSLAPRIFPLKFVSAVDIEDVLNELFLKKNQQRNYWSYDDAPQETADHNVGRLYGKVRITSEPYSNSIIVTSNSPEHMSAVEEVLKQLDVPSQAGDTTLRLTLKFAEAVTVASSVNVLFAKGGSPPVRQNAQQGQPGENRNQQQQNSSSQGGFELEKQAKEDAYYPWLGGAQDTARSSDGRNTVRPVSDLVGRVRVVPDRRSNSLLVTANVHLLPQVLKLVNDLDAPTAQVLIEAKIVEVASDYRERLGVRWAPDGTQTFDSEDMDNSFLIKSGAAYKKVFAGSAVAESLHTGVLNSSINLDFLVQFLRKNIGSKVLAEPQINIADNELGRLFVGAQVPFIERSLSTDVGGLNQTFSYKDVGVILEVTPHINNSEEVALKIRAESSNIRNGETLFGGAILDTRNFRTDLQVKSGETIVLGGIIQREQAKTVRKVPILGDIPGLGWAFKKRDTLSREVELMVFLRPRVTRSPAQVKQLLNEVEDKVPRIKEWRHEVPEPARKD